MALDRRLFFDSSVNTGDVSDSFSDQQTRQIIRDEFLRDTTVTIVLVGQETKHRKHIDWEIFSSMFDGKINKRSGILVINLPTISEVAIVAREEEKNIIYPDIPLWKPIPQRKLLESHYPHMPERIIDNLLERFVRLSVVPWSRLLIILKISASSLMLHIKADFIVNIIFQDPCVA